MGNTLEQLKKIIPPLKNILQQLKQLAPQYNRDFNIAWEDDENIDEHGDTSVADVDSDVGDILRAIQDAVEEFYK